MACEHFFKQLKRELAMKRRKKQKEKVCPRCKSPDILNSICLTCGTGHHQDNLLGRKVEKITMIFIAALIATFIVCGVVLAVS
jgi:hypothetical protein